ncbi:MAG: gamma-glutamyltransferase, partial [Chloroflexi bacterium]|nr:gamma-glutamyltransferase [Chloroflexota bacterium]
MKDAATYDTEFGTALQGSSDPTDKRAGEPGPSSFRPAVLGRRWAAAATHYLATGAAARLLEAGGHAVDAGVAAGLCLGVLEPHMTNIGGVAPIVIYDAARRSVATVAGLGTWPQAATLEAYTARYGHDMPLGIPHTVVPGGMDGWLVALQRWGTRGFSEVSRPALELAADGFPIYPRMHFWLEKSAVDLRKMPTSAAVFLSDGAVPPPRSILRQTALARTLDRLATAERSADGGREERLQAVRDLFYRGEIAREMAA